MTVVDMSVSGADGDEVQGGHQLRRMLHGEEMYLSVSDLIYLADASKERFNVERNPHAADAMERLTFVLSMLTLVVSV